MKIILILAALNALFISFSRAAEEDDALKGNDQDKDKAATAASIAFTKSAIVRPSGPAALPFKIDSNRGPEPKPETEDAAKPGAKIESQQVLKVTPKPETEAAPLPKVEAKPAPAPAPATREHSCAPYIVGRRALDRNVECRTAYTPCGRSFTQHVTVVTIEDVYSNGDKRVYTCTFND